MTNRKKKPFWVKFLSAALVVSMLIGSTGMSSFAAPENTNVEETVSNDESTDDFGEQSGTEGTGTEGTGTEGTGTGGTGAGGTGAEGTGTEGTGTEGTGAEGTGAEGTGTEGTGAEGTGTEGTGTEGTKTEGTGTEEPGTTSENNEAEEEKLPVTEEVKAFLDAVDALPDSITTAEEYDTVKAAMENVLSQYTALAEDDKNSDNVKNAKLKVDKLQEELKNDRPEEVPDENATLTEFRALLEQMEAFELTEDNAEEFCEMGYRLRELADVLFEGDYEGMEDDMARFQALCEKLRLLTEIAEEVQAFLDAVAALPDPKDVTEENLAGIEELIAKCDEAYNKLTDADREREDVKEAFGKLTDVKNKVEELKSNFTADFDFDTCTLTINGSGTLTKETVDSFLFKDEEGTSWRLNIPGVNKLGENGTTAKVLNNEIKAVVIGDGITDIGERALGGSGYKTNTLPNSTTPDPYGGSGSRSLIYVERLTLPDGLLTIGKSAFSMMGQSAKGGLFEVNFPSSLTRIEELAFSMCNKLPEDFTIAVPNAVIEGSAFYGCISIKKLTIDGAKELEPFAFNDCKNLTTVELKKIVAVGDGQFPVFIDPNLETLILTEVEEVKPYAFKGYYSGWSRLKNLTINGSDTVKTKIGDYAFYYNYNLVNVTMDRVESIGKMAFYGAGQLDTVTLTNIGTIGEQAFYGYKENTKWSRLKNVSIDVCENIGKQAFAMCYYVTSLDLNNVGTIGQDAFYYNAGLLGTVKMGKVGTIAPYAFRNCTSLTAIDSLADVDRIDGFAFYGCSNLSGLTVADITKMGFNGNYGDIMNRVQAILSGTFKLDTAPGITDITAGIPEEGWDDGKWGKSDNWSTYDNGTQLVEQARWINDNRTEAEVKVDAYYTAPKQMDYIFVADLSASMAQLGNDADMNSRFYDMQSKLLDVTNELLTAGAVYDCRVAIVTFGGALDANNPGTSTEMAFTKNAGTVKEHINSLEPLYQNTDYGLGMSKVQNLVAGNTGRNTVVVFLSDGAPYLPDGVAGSGEKTGVTAAAAIKALKNPDGTNVPIYGVLHSPGAGHDKALNAMKAVCSAPTAEVPVTVFETTDTQSFGKAMNDAFTAVYPDYTVTIPVNSAFENVRGLSVSTTSGSASYDAGSHTITWTITGMPFTKHTLRYNMSLTAENAALTGERTFDVNDGSASIAGGAVVETPQLSRTVGTSGSTPDPTPTPDPGGGDDDDDDDDPTPTPPTPEVTPIIPEIIPAGGPTTPVVPIITPVAATPTAALVSPTPEAVALADEAVPLAAEEEKQPEIEAVDEEGTPLAGGRGAAWALINFALMNLAIFESVMLLIGYFVKTKNDEEEEKRKLKKKGIFRVISLPIAVISLIVFILTEDITLPTGFVDKYTIVMLIIAIIQTVVVTLSKKKYEDEEEQQEQQEI